MSQTTDAETDASTTQESDAQTKIGDLSAIVEKERLQQVIDQLTVTVHEGILRIGRDGLEVRVIDPANVASTDIHLEESGFESVGDGKFPIGTNLDQLDKHLGYANKGELIQLSYKAETRMLNVHYGNTDLDMAAIDPDAIRSEPDMPDLDYTATATLSGAEFRKAIKQCGEVTDHVEITADPESGELVIRGDGDTDDVTKRYGREDLVDGKFDSETVGLYSIGYLTGDDGLLAAVPKDTDITISYSAEMPMLMEYEFADGHGQVTLLLAPRIQAQ